MLQIQRVLAFFLIMVCVSCSPDSEQSAPKAAQPTKPTQPPTHQPPAGDSDSDSDSNGSSGGDEDPSTEPGQDGNQPGTLPAEDYVPRVNQDTDMVPESEFVYPPESSCDQLPLLPKESIEITVEELLLSSKSFKLTRAQGLYVSREGRAQVTVRNVVSVRLSHENGRAGLSVLPTFDCKHFPESPHGQMALTLKAPLAIEALSGNLNGELVAEFLSHGGARLQDDKSATRLQAKARVPTLDALSQALKAEMVNFRIFRLPSGRIEMRYKVESTQKDSYRKREFRQVYIPH